MATRRRLISGLWLALTVGCTDRILALDDDPMDAAAPAPCPEAVGWRATGLSAEAASYEVGRCGDVVAYGPAGAVLWRARDGALRPLPARARGWTFSADGLWLIGDQVRPFSRGAVGVLNVGTGAFDPAPEEPGDPLAVTGSMARTAWGDLPRPPLKVRCVAGALTVAEVDAPWPAADAASDLQLGFCPGQLRTPWLLTESDPAGVRIRVVDLYRRAVGEPALLAFPRGSPRHGRGMSQGVAHDMVAAVGGPSRWSLLDGGCSADGPAISLLLFDLEQSLSQPVATAQFGRRCSGEPKDSAAGPRSWAESEGGETVWAFTDGAVVRAQGTILWIVDDRYALIRRADGLDLLSRSGDLRSVSQGVDAVLGNARGHGALLLRGSTLSLWTVGPAAPRPAATLPGRVVPVWVADDARWAVALHGERGAASLLGVGADGELRTLAEGLESAHAMVFEARPPVFVLDFAGRRELRVLRGHRLRTLQAGTLSETFIDNARQALAVRLTPPGGTPTIYAGGW